MIYTHQAETEAIFLDIFSLNMQASLSSHRE
jgi:hypothetical protein